LGLITAHTSDLLIIYVTFLDPRNKNLLCAWYYGSILAALNLTSTKCTNWLIYLTLAE